MVLQTRPLARSCGRPREEVRELAQHHSHELRGALSFSVAIKQMAEQNEIPKARKSQGEECAAWSTIPDLS